MLACVAFAVSFVLGPPHQALARPGIPQRAQPAGSIAPPPRTAPAAEGSFTFAVVGDSRKGGFWEAFLGKNVDRTRQPIIDKIAACRPALVFNTGDLVKQGAGAKEWREFEKANEVFKERNVTYCPVLGNHEYRGGEEKSLAGYFSCFPALQKQLWYTMTGDHCAFVMLDSNFDKLSEAQTAAQNAWLDETLTRFQADPAVRFVFAFFHHPPFTNARYHAPDKLVQGYFVPRLERCPKVKFVFSGHVHNYERFKVHGINFVVTGGGGAPLAALLPPGKSRYRDQYDTTGKKPRGTHFCLVIVGPDSIELKTLNIDPSTLSWSVGDDDREEYPNDAVDKLPRAR